MTERDRERIGGIGGESTLGGEHRADHVRDLQLVGTAESHGGELDGARGVLGDLEICAHRGERSATRLPQLQGAVDVAREEDFFDSDLLRSMDLDERAQFVVDAREARELVNKT